MEPPALNVMPNRLPTVHQAVPAAGPSFKVDDLAYILFRHKWLILICFVLGLAVAGGIYASYKPTYISEGKLLIRYVRENRSADSIESSDQIKSPDKAGEGIVASERELLNSIDLAVEVAKAVGPTNILKAIGGGDSEQKAAAVIHKGLQIQTKPKSNVIGLTFEHPDASVTRPVINAMIQHYLKMHARIHRALDVLDEMAGQADKKRSLVDTTESQLRDLKSRLEIVSVQDAQKTLAEQIARLSNEILDTEAALAESRALLARITNAPRLVTSGPTNKANATNAIVISTDTAKLYQSILGRLDSLRRTEQGLLLQFTPTSTYVKRITDQIKEAQAERDRLLADNPGLTNVTVAQLISSDAPKPADQGPDTTALTSRISSLEAKATFLNGRLATAKSDARKIADNESNISQLERKLQLAEKQYAAYTSALEEARVDEALSASRFSNIAILQGASPPFRDSGQLMKLVGGAIAGGLGLGIALALLIEFFSDQSIRRPKQVTDSLRLPLFLSLPVLPASKNPTSGPLAPDKGGNPNALDESELTKYAEALRDRLIMHFQVRELTHKPKLVGVTSCGPGAGVTTLATSLAATLSETGEGNVLYVDVNQSLVPSAHPFRKGKAVASITDALAAETRDSAMVTDNLYAVSLSDTNSKKVGVLPKKLAGLVPQIKASDYDYIIFDLPPVTQTSATARISGLLDTTVMVLESEKTHKDLARQAVNLLSESNTQMVAVLNKHRKYLPRKLDGDL